MNRRANALLIILGVLTLVSLSLAGGGYYLLKKEQQKSAMLEEEVSEVSSRLKATEAKVHESEKTIADLSTKIKSASEQLIVVNTALSREKSDKEQALSRLQSLESDLETLKKSRQGLEDLLRQAKEESTKAQLDAQQLKAQKQELEEKITELESNSDNVELGEIVVGTSGELTGAEAVVEPSAKRKAPLKEQIVQLKANEGNVLVVNKEYNFIVISLGVKDGVSVGDVFSVYHGNKYVGDVKVEKVHDSMSAAGFSSADLKNKVSEGDKVVEKGK